MNRPQLTEEEAELAEARDEMRRGIRRARRQGVDTAQLYSEVIAEERRREIEAARGDFRHALQTFIEGVRRLDRAFDSEYIDPEASFVSGWPEWMPTVEKMLADVEEMRAAWPEDEGS